VLLTDRPKPVHGYDGQITYLDQVGALQAVGSRILLNSLSSGNGLKQRADLQLPDGRFLLTARTVTFVCLRLRYRELCPIIDGREQGQSRLQVPASCIYAGDHLLSDPSPLDH
jgi:hypothetical protein